MSVVKVPIFNHIYRNVDGVELQDQNYSLVNGYLTEAGATDKRPGLRYVHTLNDFKSPVDGFYWWSNKGILLAISNTHLYKITKFNGRFVYNDLGANAELQIGGRPSFTSDDKRCYIAMGRKIVFTDGEESPTTIENSTGSYPPSNVTQLGYLDSYILANDLASAPTHPSNFFSWSDLGDGLKWTGTNFASAAGDADYIIGLKIINRQIYLFGINTVEIWENDGSSPFIRIGGGFEETGCIAPKSIVNVGKTLYWLSSDRHFVSLSGSTVERLSSPFEKEISEFKFVNDCIGEVVSIASKTFILWTFRMEGRAYCYDVQQNAWAEWGEWSGNSYDLFIGNCYCYVPEWGVNFVGSKRDSKIYELSTSAYSDDGTPIRILRTTGHIDYGTTALKRSSCLRLRLKRGTVNLDPTAKLMVRWKDDNKNWSNEHWIDLGDLGDREIVKKLFNAGIYRTRQYQFAASSNSPIIFQDAEEEIEVLE